MQACRQTKTRANPIFLINYTFVGRLCLCVNKQKELILEFFMEARKPSVPKVLHSLKRARGWQIAHLMFAFVGFGEVWFCFIWVTACEINELYFKYWIKCEALEISHMILKFHRDHVQSTEKSNRDPPSVRHDQPVWLLFFHIEISFWGEWKGGKGRVEEGRGGEGGKGRGGRERGRWKGEARRRKERRQLHLESMLWDQQCLQGSALHSLPSHPSHPGLPLPSLCIQLPFTLHVALTLSSYTEYTALNPNQSGSKIFMIWMSWWIVRKQFSNYLN